MENRNLACRVKELRRIKALSQDDLAKNAGLSLRTVQRVENGETIPTAETLRRLADVLDVLPIELIEDAANNELLIQTIKTKYEYVHFFESKLVFSKSCEINLVEDYGKSVTFAFRTLMVFFIFIPIFAALSIFSYTIQRMDLAFYSGAICFFFLIMAFKMMLFTSGTPTINFSAITKIKIKKMSSLNVVIISFIESNRVKERSLILEKDQIETMINSLLSQNLMQEKDIEINCKRIKIINILKFIVPMIIIMSYSHYTQNPKAIMYFYGSMMGIWSIYISIKMIINTIKSRNRNVHKTNLQTEIE